MRKNEGRTVALYTKVSPEEKEVIDRKMALLGTSNLRGYLRKMAVDGYIVNLDSENHDYITVDCGDIRLTVWLPGEANKFTVGNRVTVAYHGEPATAYNIWPGQLVSVE